MSHPAIGEATGILGRLAALHARTDTAEKAIGQAARTRLAHVLGELQDLAPRCMIDEAAASSYQKLVMEAGHLRRVIEMARRWRE